MGLRTDNSEKKVKTKEIMAKRMLEMAKRK
jgi:hypothetical protein